jgi:two-component system, sensor histidine kinase and response regulator
MPEMGGFEATTLIRQSEQGTTRHVPIVAMTAHAMKGDRDRCLAAGMDEYVAKPIEGRELADVLEKVTSRSRSTAATDTHNVPAKDVLDRAKLWNSLDGDLELLKELMDLFIEECPYSLEAVRDAIARTDAEGLYRASHALRGAMSNFYAIDACEAARNLEALGTGDDFTGAEEGLTVLRHSVQELRDSLVALVEEKEPSRWI